MIRRERDERLFRTDINLSARRYNITHEAADMLLRCEITCNKVDKLSLDYLVGLCAKAGLTVAVRLVA